MNRNFASDIFCRRLHNTQNICFGNNDIFSLLLLYIYAHFSHSIVFLLVHFLLRLDQNQNLHKLFPSIKSYFSTNKLYNIFYIVCVSKILFFEIDNASMLFSIHFNTYSKEETEKILCTNKHQNQKHIRRKGKS